MIFLVVTVGSCGFRLFSILYVRLLSAGRQRVKIQINRRIQTDQILLQCLLNIYFITFVYTVIKIHPCHLN